MKRLLLSATALAVLAGPVSALTADELWADWQETISKFGGGLEASPERDGDRLILRDMRQTTTIGGIVGTTTYGDAITLVEQSDGSVRIEMPARLEMTSASEVDGQTTEQTIVVIQEGLDAVARDEGDARVYDYNVERLEYVFDDLSGGEADPAVPMTMTMTGLRSASTYADDGAFDGTVAGDLSVKVGGEGLPLDMDYALSAVTGEVSGTIPSDLPDDGTFDPFELGLEYEMELAHGGSEMTADITDPTGTGRIQSTSDSGTLTFALADGAIRYGGSGTNIAGGGQIPAFPVPVSVSLAESVFDLRVPLQKSDTPSDYALTVTTEDLVIDEALWGLFDPTGQLPRDPADLAIELSGQALVTANVFNPAEISAVAASPLQPRSLDLSRLLLSVAGAELRGQGALTFAEGPVPLPQGEMTIELDGGFGLLDKLVALGFVPPQQVAIVRGMAGAVTEQVGDDQLRSVLTFGPAGVTANGLPLPF